MCGAALDATGAGLAVTAVAVVGWHRRAPFCPRCGHLSALARAGWARICPKCSLEEFPRTDPAVICLVHDGADHVLLARQPIWPAGRFSVLAGFVEAGESLEACVAREVLEEVGVAVTHIRYLGSQPWPFPRSLMIGFEAVGDRAQPVRPAEGEIAEARWVSRDDVRAAIAAGSWADRTGPVHGHPGEVVLPGEISIAGRMLEAWAR
jgi:NAD+ diphosphatase